MTNIAYTKTYQDEIKKYDPVFLEKNYVYTEFKELSFNYVLEERAYHAEINNSFITAGIHILRDKVGNEIYRYRNLDTGGDFCSLIKHADGHMYLIFRTELYGYGVFDLTVNKDFFYIPKGPESFIWTNVFYNPDNNILLVSGCYWACPYGIHMLDFSNPMYETRWIDIQERLDNGYEKYDDIDFLRWENDVLILKVFVVETERTEEIKIQKEEYRQWLKGKK